MSGRPSKVTVLSENVLDVLGDSLGDKQIGRVMAEKYRALLPGRIERLTTAMAEDDMDTALDAVKSLRVSSVMVGALELAELATLMEAEIGQGSIGTAAVLAPTLPAAGQRAATALTTYLSR